MSLKIEFSSPLKGFIPEPKPSLHHIPEGYKKMHRYIDNKIKNENRTVKMCIPFLDALSVGYTIPFPADMNCFYDKDQGQMKFEVHPSIPEEFNQFFHVEAHFNSQISESLRYNLRSVDAVFKFKNPWRIKTPPGYSCIFTNPINQNTNFKIIEGIVDTDEYENAVHFPFYWTLNHEKQYMIQKGSPMVQVIPFKRDNWVSEVCHQSRNDLKENSLKWGTLFHDVYKRITWKKKSFK